MQDGSDRKSKPLKLFVFALLFAACAKKSDVEEAQGDVQVQIGVQTSESNYALQVVQLNGIEKLSEVGGTYAKFFYSPGATDEALTGNAPHAAFVRTSSFFVPIDYISMQMATIYFHLQNLAQFDRLIGAGEVNHWPRSVGLETQISDSGSVAQKNNAFYNGQTDSMMFVPFTNTDVPISMNAGIIAHEHFHSLFYKVVIKPAALSRKSLSAAASTQVENLSVEQNQVKFDKITPVKQVTDEERAELFNDTFLRGINEGLADFWGWVYTNDPEFMRWSLPSFQADRTLQMSEGLEGEYETEEKIFKKIADYVQYSDNPQGALINYAYKIGTPYARFMKQLTLLQAEAQNISIADSKKIMAQVVLNYMKELEAQIKKLDEKQNANPLGLFQFVIQLAEKNNLVRFNEKNCDLLAKYLNKGQDAAQKIQACEDKKTTP